MRILFLSLVLVACATKPPEPKPDLCAVVRDPHLCLITIDKQTYVSHEANRCLAMRKLKKILEERGHNPLIAEKAECGRVFE